MRSAMRAAAPGSLRRRWSAMLLARCWVRVCLRRGIISPRLVPAVADVSRGMSKVVTAAVGRHRRGNNSRLPGG